MSEIGHNSGKVLLEIDAELAAFIVENCDSNLSLGLAIMMNRSVSRKGMETLVANTEKFKKLKRATKEAIKRGTRE